MLQQILRDLYVDPEILSELDESQKQALFCKMREEQVRRWHIWDEQYTTISKKSNQIDRKHKKSVSFLQGNDGEPWVWVMGEHENDSTIEEILKQEALDKARQLAEQESDVLNHDCTTPIEEEIYCSVEDLPSKETNCNQSVLIQFSCKDNYQIGHYNHKENKYNVINTNADYNVKRVAQKVAQWERRLTGERACEILQNFQAIRLQEKQSGKQEVYWKTQESKTKEVEMIIKSKEESKFKQAINCFPKQEIPKRIGMDHLDHIEPYFHGLITRSEAEALLQNQPVGAFLVRLSERLWSYAISYKTKDKCKHYLISATHNYLLLANSLVKHKSLADLIAHYKEYPLMGEEKLMKPCLRQNDAALQKLLQITKF